MSVWGRFCVERKKVDGEHDCVLKYHEKMVPEKKKCDHRCHHCTVNETKDCHHYNHHLHCYHTDTLKVGSTTDTVSRHCHHCHHCITGHHHCHHRYHRFTTITAVTTVNPTLSPCRHCSSYHSHRYHRCPSILRACLLVCEVYFFWMFMRWCKCSASSVHISPKVRLRSLSVLWFAKSAFMRCSPSVLQVYAFANP
jgi:hypothetical protein